MNAPFTYPEVGATEGSPPLGYNVLRYHTNLGPGVLDRAAEMVLTFGMHRAVGLRVRSSAARAAPDVAVTSVLGAGPLSISAPCRVVSVLEEPHRRGFTYGTVAGSPLEGEERFLLELDEAGDVIFSILAFSRPAAWYTKAAGPLLVAFQQLFARRCGAVLRRACA